MFLLVLRVDKVRSTSTALETTNVVKNLIVLLISYVVVGIDLVVDSSI